MSLLVGIVVGLLASLAGVYATRLRNRGRVALERRECEQELERAQQEITHLEAAAASQAAPKVIERRPPETAPRPAATPAPISIEPSEEEAEAESGAVEAGGDDLRRIDGIGPKTAELLAAAGIRSFRELAAVDSDRLRELLDGAGSRFRLADPDSWPQQAALAARGDWEGLANLQRELKGGRGV